MSEGSILTYVPPLITLLAQAEIDTGSPLTEKDVLRIRDHGVCIMLSKEEALKLAEARGYPDINPDRVWEEWQDVRQRLTAPPKPKPMPYAHIRQLFSNLALDQLPADPQGRHEAFVEMFGRQVFCLRNDVLKQTRALIEAPQAHRDKMGSIYSKEYTAAAHLSAEGQTAALDLCRKSVDAFLRDLLLLLAHSGMSVELPLGPDHAFAFKLLVQVIDQDDGEVVEEHVVNEGGEKHFSDYYGRWLNNHKDA